jgi:hypothetical protein
MFIAYICLYTYTEMLTFIPAIPIMSNILIFAFTGDLQGTVLAMRDCAYEASVALSAFCRVSKSHTALTSECGSMLEEVWPLR